MNRHLLFKILTIGFLVVQAFPPFFYFIPVGAAVCMALYVGCGFILFPNLLGKKSVISLLLYGIITFFMFLSGNAFFNSFNDVIVPFVNMISALLILEYTLKYDYDYKFTKLVLLEVVLLNVIMTFISIPQLMINRNIIRGASATGVEGTDEFVYYWVISYATVHGLPFLMAPLVFLCRKTYGVNKKLFVFWAIVAASLYYIIFMSNATTSFLLATIMVALSLLFSFEHFNHQNIIRVVLVGLFALILTSPPVIIPIIDAAQSVMNPGADNYSKMDEIKDNIIYGEADGDLGSRQRLYNNSRTLFFESPLFGTNSPENISHHTYILDRLALLGIFFIIPLVLLFIFNFKSVYNRLHHTKVTYTFAFSCMIIMLYLKNEFGSGTWLYGFAILPILCRYIDYLIDNKNNKKIILK